MLRRLTARTALAAGLAAVALLTAGPALASAPAGTGSFHTWHAAQRAAGFRLKKPHKLFGLTRTHPILVSRCQVTGRTGKRDVYAQWNSKDGQTYLVVDQDNAGLPCSNFGAARFLGTWRVQGHKARMYGFCGRARQPSCTSKRVTLVLAWKAGRRYYTDYSRNEWRRTLVSFSRSLRFL